MSNGKMKGLLKGLRFISQIFENEKEPEMEIGYPTDVKHVAHIGWEGPSVNSPSWMNEFSSTQTLSSSSPTITAAVSVDSPRQLAPEGSGRRGVRSPNFPAEKPKSSRRESSSDNTVDSPGRDKSEKPKSRRSSRGKDSSNHNNSSKASRKPMDPDQGSDSPTLKLPSIPKKSRRKKSKDASGGGSTRSRSRTQTLETF